MDPEELDTVVAKLRTWGLTLAPGLTDAELAQVERTYNFRFPPDLKCLLQHVLPISNGGVDWRDGFEENIRSRLAWPLDGILFDIQHNVFWLDEWGPKPPRLEAAFAIARSAVAEAPTLIPVFGHRYIPGEPHLAGNPIFSVYQTDSIYYGYDLRSYFECEFARNQCPDTFRDSPRPIRFWDALVS